MAAFLAFKYRASHDGALARTALLLTVFIIAFALLVENGAFTTNARALFAAYPLMILAVVLAGTALLQACGELEARAWKFGPKILLLSFAGLGIALNLHASSRLVSIKQDAAAYVDAHAGTTRFYVCSKDPHSFFLQVYFGKGVTMVDRLEDILCTDNQAAALILGPRGGKSGRTILARGVLEDFFPLDAGIAKPQAATETFLPYFAFHPFFALEEENCQYLYFSGQLPHNDDKDKHLAVWTWKGPYKRPLALTAS